MNEDVRKIVELEIDLDDIQLEDMGVSVVSFVEEPAIEVDFMAFSQEQFVKPIGDEEHNPFMSRCIGVLVGEEGYEADQAAAICHTYWEEKHGPTEMNTDYFDLDEACKSGYTAIGMKTKNGRLVPNCVPIENSREEFETYNDYPESAKNNARRALDWAEEHGWGSCGEATGKARAHQLANGENISEETIARMASFARHRQNSKTPYSEGCGKLMWDAWGGTSGIEWASNKLKKIREESDYDTGNLTPYIDQEDELRKKQNFSEVMSEDVQEIVLKWAEENGEVITEEYTSISLAEAFENVGDIAKAIQGLDILGKIGIKKDEPAEIKYRYTGPISSNSRRFCRSMIRLNKVYTRDEIDQLGSLVATVNPNMGPNGRGTYDVFKYKGSVNCKHHWTKVALFKPANSSRVLMIDQGPAEGDAGERMIDAPSGGHTSQWIREHGRFSFAIQDDEKRLVAGPLMTPNKFILRRDESGEPYYVFFSKDTIRRIQERFNKLGYQNVTDVDHDGNLLSDNILLEQWIIESREHDKSRFYGFDNLTTGTWFGVYKVNNEQTWQDIKAGKIKGFSIAGDFLNKAKPLNDDDAKLNEIVDILKKTKQ